MIESFIMQLKGSEMNKSRKENDFVSFEHKFKDDKCTPKHDVNIALNKQIFKEEEEIDESFWITVWGKWGEEEHQLDLSFKNKNECIKFINGLREIVISDYDREI